MNHLKKIHNCPQLKAIRAKRKRLEAQQKALGKKYQATFKKVARRLRKKR